MRAPRIGQRASLPPAGYRMPSNLSADGLAAVLVSEDGGEHRTYDFRQTRGPEQLKRQLVAAFAVACSPTGTLRRPKTCRSYAYVLTRFLAFAADRDRPVTSVAKITPGVWAEWILAEGNNGRAHGGIRRLLREVDSLPPATRAAIEVRGTTPRPASSVKSYSLAEFKRIRSVAQKTVNEVELRIRGGVGLLQRWHNGQLAEGSHEWRLGSLLEQVSTTGDLPRYPCGKFTEEVQAGLRSVPDGFPGLLRMLYPTPTELGAMTTLLICEQGWNLSVLEEMDVPDQRPDGDVGEVPIHRVEVVKWRRPRSNRFASNNLVDLGPGSAGRAVRQVLAITAHARECMSAQGIGTRRLLVARCLVRNGRNRLPWTIGAPPHCVEEWANTLGRGRDPDQVPLVISPRRLRRSHQALYGGTRQNTQRTHEDVYLLRDEQVRADAVDTVAQGLHDALDHARATVRMRMVAAPPAGQGRLRRAVHAEIPADRLDDLHAGRLDTATGACLDFEHSPFAPAGPCSVSFLLCFACGNAVAVPRHLPRIIYLHEAMTALRSALSPAAWSLDWAQHHARVSDLLDTHTSPAERGQLRLQLSEPDRRLVDQMLQRRLDT